MTCRTSSASARTMTRSTTNCKTFCRSSTDAPSSRLGSRPQNAVRSWYTRPAASPSARGRPAVGFGRPRAYSDGTENSPRVQYRMADRPGTPSPPAAPLPAEQILESITDGFLAVGLDWRITYVSTAAARLYPEDRRWYVGKVFWDVFPAVDDTVFGPAYRRAMRDRGPVRVEGHYGAFDRWFDVNIYPTPPRTGGWPSTSGTSPTGRGPTTSWSG